MNSEYSSVTYYFVEFCDNLKTILWLNYRQSVTKVNLGEYSQADWSKILMYLMFFANRIQGKNELQL